MRTLCQRRVLHDRALVMNLQELFIFSQIWITNDTILPSAAKMEIPYLQWLIKTKSYLWKDRIKQMANVKVYVCENGVMCFVIRDVCSVLMQVWLFCVPVERIWCVPPGHPMCHQTWRAERPVSKTAMHNTEVQCAGLWVHQRNGWFTKVECYSVVHLNNGCRKRGESGK